MGLILIGLVRLVLVLAAIVGFILCAFGIPLGIVLLLTSKNGKHKKLSLWLIIGGPVLLVLSFLFWAIVAFFGVFFGLGMTSLPKV